MPLDAAFFLADPDTAAAQVVADALEPAPPIDLVTWARENVEFGPDSPYPGPFDPDRMPHMREILAALSPEHPARVVTVVGNAQGGKTVMAMIMLGALLDQDPSACMITHPTLENARRWSNTKWRPFVKAAAALAPSINVEAERDSRSTTLYMERRDGRGYLLVNGANSPASLSMVTIKYQVQDDLSKWETTPSGDPEVMADKRSEAHPFAKILKISTPTVKGQCRISADYERGTQKVYEVPCPHCGAYQALEWTQMLPTIDAGKTDEAGFVCRACGCIIEHRHKTEMVARGRWVARNPGAREESFRIWAAYLPNISWTKIAQDWLSAKGDPAREQAFHNDTLGLAYEIAGEAPAWERLRERAEATGHARGFVPPGVVFLTAGADCQVDRVEIRVWGWGRDRRRWLIDREIIAGPISEEETQAKLTAFWRHRTWPDEQGRRRPIDQIAIDTGYQTTHVYDWVKRQDRMKVMAVKGERRPGAPELDVGRPPSVTRGGRRRRRPEFTLWLVGVGRIKAALYADLAKEDPLARGHVGLPTGIDEEEYRQLTAEKYVPVQKRSGYVEYEWRKTYAANEALDCAVYAEAAARRLDWHRLTNDQWDALEADLARREAEPQEDLFDPSLERRAAALIAERVHTAAAARDGSGVQSDAAREDDDHVPAAPSVEDRGEMYL